MYILLLVVLIHLLEYYLLIWVTFHFYQSNVVAPHLYCQSTTTVGQQTKTELRGFYLITEEEWAAVAQG